LLAAGVGPAILPRDGGTGRLAAGLDGDEGRDHRRQPNAAPAPRRRRVPQLRGHRFDRREPVLRRLFAGPGAGPAGGVGDTGAGDDGSLFGQRHALQPRGAEVEADVDAGVALAHVPGSGRTSQSWNPGVGSRCRDVLPEIANANPAAGYSCSKQSNGVPALSMLSPRILTTWVRGAMLSSRRSSWVGMMTSRYCSSYSSSSPYSRPSRS